MKPEKAYLETLIASTEKKFEEFAYPDLDLSSASITYIPTKKRNFMGLKAGIDGLAEMKKYKVKESSKIRSNCMFYHKFYKVDEQVCKIDSFVSGHDRLTDSYIAYFENNHRYLFPYYGREKATGLYILVTHFENGRVTEEYFVNRGQIVYESYEYSEDGKVGYYYINFVPTGKYPVLGESIGYFLTDSLEYVEEERYAWYQDEQ